jgi:hypothetical protein
MEKLKKGKYYVGDPCYIFGKSWSEVLEKTDYFNSGEIQLLFGKKCIAGGTAYGDGTYKDNYGREYWVDAGLIGIMPVSLLSIDKEYNVLKINKEKGMHIVEFNEDFEVSIDNGVFKFGDIIINTKDDEDNEDAGWDDYYDYYNYDKDDN